MFSTVSSPLYSTHHNAIYNLDPAGGGSGLTVGQLYTQFNITENSGLDTTPNVGDFQIFRYEGGTTVAQSKTIFPTFTSGEQFKMQESTASSLTLSTEKTVTVTNGDGSTIADNEDFVSAINGAGFTNVEASIVSSGQYRGAVQITHKLGGEIRMVDSLGTPLADAGFTSGNADAYGDYATTRTNKIDNLYQVPTGETLDSTANNALLISNWKRLSYVASTTAPTNEPANGTLWYDNYTIRWHSTC